MGGKADEEELRKIKDGIVSLGEKNSTRNAAAVKRFFVVTKAKRGGG